MEEAQAIKQKSNKKTLEAASLNAAIAACSQMYLPSPVVVDEIAVKMDLRNGRQTVGTDTAK